MRFRSLSEIHRSGIEASMLRQTFIGIALLGATACSPEPLTTDQLYGSTRDAGRVVDANVPKLTADTASVDTFVPPDVMPPPDVMLPPDIMSPGTGIIDGIVTDKCSGEIVNALVGIGEKNICSNQAKGRFFITGVPTNVAITLAACAPGYAVFSQRVVVLPTGLPTNIELVRFGARTEKGCDVPRPAAPVCLGDLPGWCSQ